MKNGNTRKTANRPSGLRERLRQANEMSALSAETVDMLLGLPERLSETATTIAREVNETERNLAFTVEKLRRHAERTAWIQTGVIVLALIAGMLGGLAAALLILVSMR
jgi:energy-converting hydrogenase Eha subunit B